jgi:hypothetical protein
MADALAKPPGKVQAIGVMHLIGGILNLMLALFWGIYGAATGVLTFGIGLFLCCPVFILLPVGIMEIVSGAKHLSSNHTGLRAPKMVAFGEISSILGCSTFSMIFGIVTLVFLSDPEVAEYYESKQLTG